MPNFTFDRTAGDYSVRAEYDRSAAVVTGQVIAERPVAESGRHSDGVVYTVKVETVYRGDRRGVVDVFSENSTGRFPMQLQERYLLFIYPETGRLVVDNCGNSGPVSEKTAVLRAVKSLVSPKRGGQNPNSALHADAAYGRAGERERYAYRREGIGSDSLGSDGRGR